MGYDQLQCEEQGLEDRVRRQAGPSMRRNDGASHSSLGRALITGSLVGDTVQRRGTARFGLGSGLGHCPGGGAPIGGKYMCIAASWLFSKVMGRGRGYE